MICGTCGIPIKRALLHPGGTSGFPWVHDCKLKDYKVFDYEVQAILNDPPIAREPLHRKTFLHTAKP